MGSFGHRQVLTEPAKVTLRVSDALKALNVRYLTSQLAAGTLMSCVCYRGIEQGRHPRAGHFRSSTN